MKRILLVLVSVTMTLLGSAQDPVSKIFDQYSGKEGFTTVNITGDMLNMITKMEEERKDTAITSRLSSVRILAREKDCDNQVPVLDLKSELYDKLDKKTYKEMMSVKESDQDVLILVKEAEGRISEFLLIVSGKNESVLIQAKGDILMSEMADLAGKYQMKGFEQLKKLEK